MKVTNSKPDCGDEQAMPSLPQDRVLSVRTFDRHPKLGYDYAVFRIRAILSAIQTGTKIISQSGSSSEGKSL